MAQNFAFLAYGNTLAATVGGAAGAVTLTVGTTQTGLPATAARIWNSGTAIAYVLFGTGTTITAAGNAMPIPASVAPVVLRTGGVNTVQLATTGTITTTVFVTGGEGID